MKQTFKCLITLLIALFCAVNYAEGKVPVRQGRRIKLNFPSTAYLSSPHSIPLSVVLG